MPDDGQQTLDDNPSEPIEIQEEMERSFLDYAMSVITARALPDVRDGLKPVHRRILYGMYEQGLRPDRQHKKCANAVGQVMAFYHPHGDGAIYDALARMAQDFSLRYPLIDGHGNFGSPDPNDRPAASRYTEARLAPLAMQLLEGDRRRHRRHADHLRRQHHRADRACPRGIPTCSSTAAAASRSGWPPTSRRTTCARSSTRPCTCSTTRTRRVADLQQFVLAPDFPTGALILGRAGLSEVYETGRGSVRMRARSRRSSRDAAAR